MKKLLLSLLLCGVALIPPCAAMVILAPAVAQAISL
jgi:hypothetical protein